MKGKHTNRDSLGLFPVNITASVQMAAQVTMCAKKYAQLIRIFHKLVNLFRNLGDAAVNHSAISNQAAADQVDQAPWEVDQAP